MRAGQHLVRKRRVGRPETKELSLALLKKGIARVLTGRTGTWWFDMWGGWFDAPEYRELLQKAEGWIGDQSTGVDAGGNGRAGGRPRLRLLRRGRSRCSMI